MRFIIAHLKHFLQVVKPLLTNKNPMSEMITFIDDGKFVADDMEIAECFNAYFINITNSLEIDPVFKEVSDQFPSEQMVMTTIDNYSNH